MTSLEQKKETVFSEIAFKNIKANEKISKNQPIV